MSVKEFGEEECTYCGSYHCANYFCVSCLIGLAVKNGANKDSLIKDLRDREIEITDFDLKEADYLIEKKM
jgi:hypothetical protein